MFFIIIFFRQNILVTVDFRAKNADFEFAIQLKKKSAAGQTKTMCTAIAITRTDGYCAPEVLVGKYSLKSDVYSYGLSVYCHCACIHVTKLYNMPV